MSSLRERLAAVPDDATAPKPAATEPGHARRVALRETVMLWAMRGAMLAYGLAMVVAAEATIGALRALF